MKYQNYTKQNINKYNNIQRTEFIKTIGYHFLETVAFVGIIILGIGIITIL